MVALKLSHRDDVSRCNVTPAQRFCTQVVTWGYLNPFNSNEIVIDNEIVIHVHDESDDRVYITNLRALSVKEGAGTRLMTRLTALADILNVTLTLQAYPLKVEKEKRIPVRKLREFYKRFGFVVDDNMMTRRPRV